ncbi:MAG: hypothetical protein FWC68_02955 [Oscillospiraceae bacterium]|nr:hypothetical protein [Oscillospiraceae bacterium]
MRRHYVEYFYPGIFLSESSVEEVSHRDFDRIVMPERAFAFSFFDREEVEQDGETLVGKPKNISPKCYEGKVYTLDEVKKAFPEAETLIFNMEANGWERVVKTIRGNWQPLEEGDCVRG